MQESCEKNIILFILINIGCKVREKSHMNDFLFRGRRQSRYGTLCYGIWGKGEEEGDICGIDFVCEGMRL